jgi:hypothetical protein
MAQEAGGNRSACHVIVYGKPNVIVAGDRLHRLKRTYLPLRQAYCAFPIDADGVNLSGRWPDKDDGIQVGSLQGQGVPFVFEQHSRLFTGLLDDPGILIDRLGGDLVL